MLLGVDGAEVHYHKVAALKGLSLSVPEGGIVTIIGANGAGKTTTFNVITGFYRPTAGKVVYRGEDISGLSTNQIAKRGLVRTFQHTTLFQEFTVFKNVLVGCHLHARVDLLGAVLGTGSAAEREIEDRADEILAFMGLAERREAEIAHRREAAEAAGQSIDFEQGHSAIPVPGFIFLPCYRAAAAIGSSGVSQVCGVPRWVLMAARTWSSGASSAPWGMRSSGDR